jgi:two-component system sensor histidine kinase KdpD
MIKQRRKPEEFLQIAKEEQQRKKAKLKIFFGAAPGVGKTYTMLSEALTKLTEEGLDVVAGVVETHGRMETKVLLDIFEILPRVSIQYRGKLFEEFDLDAAIKRKPALILVDEMAHTNVTGVRHVKRWQDIEELLNRGIDVYTTLNVQHIESLNDVIRQITGVRVRETVPDLILELADAIELVDLPPEDLLLRLHEGKVYIPEQAELALQHFFRSENLTALRELALRFTAESVDEQMQVQRKVFAEKATWPTVERLLVCVDHKPFSEKLIRTTFRMAKRFKAEWLAVFVDSPRVKITEKQRQRAIQNLRFAEQSGAETSILGGYDIGKEIIDFSHMHNVTTIVIGKKPRQHWKDFFFRSLSNELVRISGAIDVYIITDEKPEIKPKWVFAFKKPVSRWFDYIVSFIVIGLCTVINYFLYSHLAPSNLIMIYLLGVVFIAARGRLGPSIMASILSVIAYDFFFIPPRFSFAINDFQYLVTLLVMLLVTQVISHLTIIAKRQSEATQFHSRYITTLYHLTRTLASHRGVDQLLRIAEKHISEVFDSNVLVLLPNSRDQLVVHTSTDGATKLNAKERSIAQWVYDMGQVAGLGTPTLSLTNALYYPLQGSSGKIGVLRIQPRKLENFIIDGLIIPEQSHLLQTFVRQIVLAIEVDKLQEKVKKSQLEAEIEGLRSILLNSISKELQVPLKKIQHILKKLIAQLNKLKIIEIKDYVKNIKLHTKQFNSLIDDLLQILQLEAGIIELKKEPYPLDRIVDRALNKLIKSLQAKPVTVDIPPNLPKIHCDHILIEQVFVNLIDHTIKFTPPEAPIDISADLKENFVEVSIAGHPQDFIIEDIEQIFERYYKELIPPNIEEYTLSLSICRSIIHLHGGKIWVESHKDLGGIFKFMLEVSS